LSPLFPHLSRLNPLPAPTNNTTNRDDSISLADNPDSAINASAEFTSPITTRLHWIHQHVYFSSRPPCESYPMTTKKNWPLRWDLLLRYRLIEIIALWEGRLTTNHLSQAFGIGRQQASGDINAYLRDIGPGNLDYDRSLKGYVPSATFKPHLTLGSADEYLLALAHSNELSHTFETLQIQMPNTEVLTLPMRDVRPEVVRPIVQAARAGKRLEVEYASMDNPKPEIRVIAPHTLVSTGLRWHVRAWCEQNKAYRNFVLSRRRGGPEV